MKRSLAFTIALVMCLSMCSAFVISVGASSNTVDYKYSGSYIYNWGDYVRCGMTPKRTPKFCADQAREFLKYGVKGLYRCGFGENFGMEGPSYYVYGNKICNSFFSST